MAQGQVGCGARNGTTTTRQQRIRLRALASSARRSRSRCLRRLRAPNALCLEQETSPVCLEFLAAAASRLSKLALGALALLPSSSNSTSCTHIASMGKSRGRAPRRPAAGQRIDHMTDVFCGNRGPAIVQLPRRNVFRCCSWRCMWVPTAQLPSGSRSAQSLSSMLLRNGHPASCTQCR